jgi:hypothetical protein
LNVSGTLLTTTLGALQQVSHDHVVPFEHMACI